MVGMICGKSRFQVGSERERELRMMKEDLETNAVKMMEVEREVRGGMMLT